MNSQNAQVLAHLKSGKSITPIAALHLFGSFRLGARIHELKSDGHKITKDMVEVEKSDGSIARVAEYSLEAPNVG